MKLVKYIVLTAITAIFFTLGSSSVSAWVTTASPVSSSIFVIEDNYGQIAVDASGNVYVTFATPGGINKYDADGNFLLNFGPSSTAGVAITSDGDIVMTSWDASFGDQAVFKYDSSGNPIDISTTDMGDGIFIFAYGVAADSLGNVYVSDFQGNGDADMVRKFDSSGNLVATITANSGSYNQIQAVAVDGDDNLYILDSGNSRIEKYNSSGVFLDVITANGVDWSYAEGFTVDSFGNIYVNDSGNERIQIFDTNGTFLQELDATDLGVGSFDYLSGMGISADGVLYVGNYSDVIEVVFDHVVPVTTITPILGDTTTDNTPILTGSTTDALTAITAVEYSIDGGAYTSCTADDGIFDELSETFSCNVSPALAEGSHTIDVRATDSKSNTNSGSTIVNYPFDVVAATVVETETSSSSSNNNGTSNSSGGSVCVPLPSGVAPNIFSIVRTGTTANIFYSPVSSDATGYQLMFGYTQGDERFGATFKAGSSTGAQQYSVDSLEADRKYYFWMRGVSDCSEPGPWSNTYELFTTNNYSGVDDETLFFEEDSDSDSDSDEATGSSEISDLSAGTGSDVEANGTTKDDGDKLNEVGPTDVKNMISGLLGDQLADEVTRQIMMPVDASYVVKTGAAGVAASVAVAATATFLTLSKTIFSSLSLAYKASSRSILRMPSDYLSSLMKYSFMGFTSGLSPFIPFLGKKKNRNGVVFDAFSFKPLAKVYVILFSKSGNLKTDFSDHLGKYEFQNLAPDDYQMRAEIVGYKFPSQIITTSLSEAGNIYLPGNVISIANKQSKVPELALPMDPTKVKKFMLIFSHKISGIAKILNPAVILISSVIIFAAVYSNPSQFNQAVAVIFVLYLLSKVVHTKKNNKENGLINNKTGKPINNSSVINQGANLSI